MYWLINSSDNSVNNWSETQFSDDYIERSHPVNETLIQVEAPVPTDIPEGTIYHDLFWNPDTSTLYADPGLIALTTKEVNEYFTRQVELNQALTSADNEDKYNQVVAAIKSLYPNDNRIDEIIADSEISTAEMQEIQNMLNEE